MTRIKWTSKFAFAEAKKYKTISDLQKNSPGAWNFLRRNGQLRAAFAHVEIRTFWTRSSAIKEAKKYETRMQFRNNASGAYDFLRKNGWLDAACKHTKSRNWTIESAFNEAKKYKIKKEFIDTPAYSFLSKKRKVVGRDLISEACAHMESARWSESKAMAAAKKYKSRYEFQMSSSGAYHFLRKAGLLDKACEHMLVAETPIDKILRKAFMSSNP